MKREQIFLISPEGGRVGPFRKYEDATAHAATVWPGVPQDDRNENPSAYDLEITERKTMKSR